jgi:hypothetical protein
LRCCINRVYVVMLLQSRVCRHVRASHILFCICLRVLCVAMPAIRRRRPAVSTVVVFAAAFGFATTTITTTTTTTTIITTFTNTILYIVTLHSKLVFWRCSARCVAHCWLTFSIQGSSVGLITRLRARSDGEAIHPRSL